MFNFTIVPLWTHMSSTGWRGKWATLQPWSCTSISFQVWLVRLYGLEYSFSTHVGCFQFKHLSCWSLTRECSVTLEDTGPRPTCTALVLGLTYTALSMHAAFAEFGSWPHQKAIWLWGLQSRPLLIKQVYSHGGRTGYRFCLLLFWGCAPSLWSFPWLRLNPPGTIGSGCSRLSHQLYLSEPLAPSNRKRQWSSEAHSCLACPTGS